MKKILSIVFYLQALSIVPSSHAGIPMSSIKYCGPTEMLIARESKKTINFYLSTQNVTYDLILFLDSIAAQETWGHIGYHGAAHEFRFYQDVIKFTIEEILAIPIRNDFHFIRIPGDPDLNLNSVKEFMLYWGEEKIDNKNDARSKQLLSMNYSVYSNFQKKGSCSASLFARNTSKTAVDYVKELEPFYESLGIDPENINKLMNVYKSIIKNKRGILLQISENSHLHDPRHEAYNFTDKQCYPAQKGGYLYDNHLISVHLKTIMTKDYTKKNANISDQQRLLINNRYTLNPHSNLKIKRWELEDKKMLNNYESKMREMIRNFPFDPDKVMKYHELLMKQWNKA